MEKRTLLRTCRICGKDKTVEHFQYGYMATRNSWCSKCKTEYNRRYNAGENATAWREAQVALWQRRYNKVIHYDTDRLIYV